jgi:hypothetical protein
LSREYEIGKAESIFNQYILKSENVPKATDIIRLGSLFGVFMRKTNNLAPTLIQLLDLLKKTPNKHPSLIISCLNTMPTYFGSLHSV